MDLYNGFSLCVISISTFFFLCFFFRTTKKHLLLFKIKFFSSKLFSLVEEKIHLFKQKKKFTWIHYFRENHPLNSQTRTLFWLFASSVGSCPRFYNFFDFFYFRKTSAIAHVPCVWLHTSHWKKKQCSWVRQSIVQSFSSIMVFFMLNVSISYVRIYLHPIMVSYVVQICRYWLCIFMHNTTCHLFTPNSSPIPFHFFFRCYSTL